MLPFEPPARGVVASRLAIEEADALAPERGGRLGAISLGFPIWRCEWALSDSMTNERSDEWEVFFARLRGSKRSFLAWDRSRPLPKAYPLGFRSMTATDGTPFEGSAAGWSQTIDADGEATLTLTGLPSGFVFGRKDYVGFRWDAADSPDDTHDRRTMVRVMSPAIADASGEVALLIEPAVPRMVVPDSAQAHLDRPACIMRMVAGDSGLEATNVLHRVSGGKLSGIQDLRP